MRVWERPIEPPDVGLVRDRTGGLWQRCRDYDWVAVDSYQEAGLPKVGLYKWYTLLGFGPLTEVEVPE